MSIEGEDIARTRSVDTQQRVLISSGSNVPIICSVPRCRQPMEKGEAFLLIANSQGKMVIAHMRCLGVEGLDLAGSTLNRIIGDLKDRLRLLP